MNDTGWIKLHRKFLNWEWYGDANVVATFIHLLLDANWEDKKWRGILIKRGSFITSISGLAESIGISIQQTRTALDKLISTNEITRSTSSNYTCISINNYDKYQQVTKSLTSEQQTNNKRITTTKEYKNIRNKEIYIMAGKYLSKWNEVFKTTYTSTKQIEKPLSEWIKSYSIDEICKSIDGIKNDPYWRDKDIEPLWLLRFRDKTGDVDRIGKFLNTKPELKLSTHLI